MDNVLDMYAHVAMDNSGVTTKDLDIKVQELKAAREDYDAKKKISGEAHAAYQKLQYELIETLQKCGKKSYKAEGVGSVSVVMKKSTSVPKDVESKKQMLQYFRELGETEYINIVSIHSGTLNSYINERVEADPNFTIPGVEKQKTTQELRFTRSRK